MLICITEKCRMGCSHCMDDARADSDKFMTKETFEKAIEFNSRYDDSFMITGGEPTEHPDFWDFMDILVSKMSSKQFVVVLTNGMNFSDKDIDKVIALREKCKGLMLFQVSSIKPYYPIHVNLDQEIFKLKDFKIVKSLKKLEPMGRAAQHKNWIFNSKSPTCFNVRSIARSTGNFRKTIYLLRSWLKFCTPSISYDGMIKMGESNLCPPVASINDTEEEIIKKIMNFTCNHSDCLEEIKKLPIQYRQAIGEK